MSLPNHCHTFLLPPFGVLLKGRNWSTEEYRYGFQNQEQDEELWEGAVTFKYRVEDARLGRFFSVDPLGQNYPYNSSYCFSENDLIRAIELEGLEKFIVTMRTFIPQYKLDNPQYIPYVNDTKYFLGDNRMNYDLTSSAFRTEQEVSVDFENGEFKVLQNYASGSVGIAADGKTVTETSSGAAAGPVPTCDETALAQGKSTTIYITVNASNKLAPGAPSIDYKFEITITPSLDAKGNPILDENNDAAFEYVVKGTTDGFPANELWITDECSGRSFLIYNRDPIESNEGPASLFPPMEHEFNLKGSSTSTKSNTWYSFEEISNSRECEGDGCD